MATSNSTTLKRCITCGDYFPPTVEYFCRNKNCIDGLRTDCKRCQKEYNLRWQHANPDKRQVISRRYRTTHRDQINAIGNRWLKNHPEKAKAKNRTRYARLKGAIGKHTATDIEVQLKRQHGKCYYCGVKVGKVYDVDHVVPVTRSGWNDVSNLVITCPSCNRRKNNRLPHEWFEGGRLL